MSAPNLQRFHRTIMQYFECETNARAEYLAREAEIQEALRTPRALSPKSARAIRRELEVIRGKLASHERYLFYLAETSPIIEEYNRLLAIPIVKRGFMSKRTNRENLNEEVLQRKQELYEQYLQIAQSYCVGIIDLPQIPSKQTEDAGNEICEECKSQDVILNVSDSMVCCQECAHEFTMCIDSTDVLPVTTNTDDTVRPNSRYEAILHFRSSMAKYQGKQQVTIPQNVYRDLHNEFARAGLLSGDTAVTFDEIVESANRVPSPKGIMERLRQPGEDTRPDPDEPPYSGIYSRITRDHIIMFLRQTRHEKHYEDVMLIHYTLTGVSPPNIGHLEAALERDFQELMNLYHREYVLTQNPALEDGKSFKSNYYILYRLLQKHGYRCNRQDFSNMLKTPDREIFYDTVCKDLFTKLGWAFNSEF